MVKAREQTSPAVPRRMDLAPLVDELGVKTPQTVVALSGTDSNSQ